jgi:hypothetical protein
LQPRCCYSLPLIHTLKCFQAIGTGILSRNGITVDLECDAQLILLFIYQNRNIHEIRRMFVTSSGGITGADGKVSVP